MSNQQPRRVVYGEVPRFGHQQAPDYGSPNTLWTPPMLVWTGEPQADRAPLAGWGRRVGAYLIDMAPGIVTSIVAATAYALVLLDLAGSLRAAPRSTVLIVVTAAGALGLAALAWTAYNRWVTAGRTGQSAGKRILGLRLLSEQTGQPIGGLNALLRDLVHLLDGVACLGYLWPLWDDKRQTFADKIIHTVVVVVPDPTS